VLKADERLRTRIQRNLDTHERSVERMPGLRPAAVAMTLVADHDDRACFVITRRVSTLREHSGQWALPGEEVGLRLGRERVLGLLDDYPTRSGFRITPVVVWAGGPVDLVPNPEEVAEAHRPRIEDLDAPGIPKLFDLGLGDHPVLSVRIFDQDIFAPTAAVIYQFREVAIHGRGTRVAHYDQPPFAWK